ncbi:uncharacterized protein FYW61_018973 isoform 1-T3 [Anableps anableps]
MPAAAVSVLSLINAVFCAAASAGQRTVSAEPGQNVPLPCRAPAGGAVVAVEWSRADLGSEYVLLFRDEQMVPFYQHPSFRNRVDLLDPRMKDGDVSLVLKAVTAGDRGTYECRVFQSGTRIRKRAHLDSDPISVVVLDVAPPPPPGAPSRPLGSSASRAGRVGPAAGPLLPLLAAVQLRVW